MNTVLRFLKSFIPVVESREEHDERYLAQAVDICDLERRLREVDERGRANLSPVALGLYPR